MRETENAFRALNRAHVDTAVRVGKRALARPKSDVSKPRAVQDLMVVNPRICATSRPNLVRDADQVTSGLAEHSSGALRTDGTLHAHLRHQHNYTRRGSGEAID